jgi:hypothetical protein
MRIAELEIKHPLCRRPAKWKDYFQPFSNNVSPAYPAAHQSLLPLGLCTGDIVKGENA